MLNYIDMLDRAVRHDPERAALIDERGSCSATRHSSPGL